MSNFELDTFQNPIQPDCLINHSRVWSLNQESRFGDIGIKYVMNGEEFYSDGLRRFKVKSGEFLLGNNAFEGEVTIQSKEAVKGICIYISKKVITEVAELFQLENELNSILIKEDFLWHIHPMQRGSELSFTLHKLQSQIEREGLLNTNRLTEFFYYLAEAILADHLWLKGMKNRIPARKSSTSTHVLNRIIEARSIIETSFGIHINIDELATSTGISTYHFIRLFTASAGVSPYAYANQIRMQHAMYLLREGASITQVAEKTGFADIQSFSKAFKRVAGNSPSQVH